MSTSRSWIGAGTILGAFVPIAGLALIALFNIYYWLPISGEIGRAGGRKGVRT